uniref:Secreted protein n=1 Tax=Steinernema glaseri TaxID=37863 RepID=A0A1I7YD27_9BILA
MGVCSPTPLGLLYTTCLGLSPASQALITLEKARSNKFSFLPNRVGQIEWKNNVYESEPIEFGFSRFVPCPHLYQAR